jgi:DNA adenine methylase
MIYMGGKSRFTKDLLPVILKDRKPNQTYAEPFCGGLGTLSEVHGKRIAGDINKYLIAMWKGVQSGRRRRAKITKTMYDAAKKAYDTGNNKKVDDFTIGWVGFMASYRGVMFGGFVGDSGSKRYERDYMREHVVSIREQSKGLKGVKFNHCNYWELKIPKNSIIYCDPPYEGTSGYNKKEDEFNHEKFWEWCRKMSLKGHQVFVSEYKAPHDFICVWKMPVKSNLSHTLSEAENRVEKLFAYKPTWKRKKKIQIKKLF